MKAIDDIREKLKELKDAPDPTVVAYLQQLGKEALDFADREVHDKYKLGVDLGNQLDAYGYGVYFNGQLIKQGYLPKKRRMDHIGKRGKNAGKMIPGAVGPDRHRHKYGRPEALHAIQQHVAQPVGYELFLCNAMYYSSVHEEGRGKEYPVLSCAGKLLTSRVADIKGAKVYFVNYGW